MSRRGWDLWLVIVCTLLTLGEVWGGVCEPVLRAVFGALFVLLLPGYALMAALFPSATLGVSERGMGVLGLSLAVSILGGLVLHLTPWGLQAKTWAVLLSTITLGASGTAAWRRRCQVNRPGSSPLGLRAREGVWFGLAACVVLGAIAWGTMSEGQQAHPGYTLLWMLPVHPDQPELIRVGLLHAEKSPVTYRLQVIHHGEVLSDKIGIVLRPGQTWEQRFQLLPDQISGDSIEAILYRLDQPDVVYRRVKVSSP